MGDTVQVRNLDPDVLNRLRRAADREGMSLSAFLRQELTRLADLVEVRERAGALRGASTTLGGPFTDLGAIDRDEIVAIIREERGKR
jgi:plasmid stability protein